MKARPDAAEEALQKLLTRIRACRICAGELPHQPRPVIQASTRARILIVGQAPGHRVHESGLPFDDNSGRRLRAWLGVDREAFYDPKCFSIAPMGLCYPGSGKQGDLPPRPECAPAWRQELHAHLPDIDLTLVIGRYAMDWYLPDRSRSVTETVHNWRQHWPGKLPLPHPSPRNTLWLRRNPWFQHEVVPALRKRVRLLLSG